jgi:hypothetical protein
MDSILIRADSGGVLVEVDGKPITERVAHITVDLTPGKLPFVRLELAGLTLDLAVVPDLGGNKPAARAPKQTEAKGDGRANKAEGKTAAKAPEQAPAEPKQPESPMFTEADDDDIPFGKRPAEAAGKGGRGGW